MSIMFFRVAGFILLALVVNHVVNIVYMLGFHKVVFNQYPGPCITVPGIDKGSEDVTVTSDGLAFISSEFNGHDVPCDHRLMRPNIRGKIFLFDFNHPENDVIELPLKGAFDRESFYPHGISLYEDPNTGEKRLFVINHNVGGDDHIEIFSFDETTTSLNHLKTVKGKHIFSVNDVVAVGPDSFYYTNDKYFVQSVFMNIFEAFGGFSWASIGFYDGTTDRIVKSGLQFPNGINVSPDGRYIYATYTFRGQLVVFERKQDNSIEEVQEIGLCAGADNIEVDRKTGDLWVACHPMMYKLLQHTQNISLATPSHVLRVRFDSNSAPYDKVDIRQVLMDDGSFLKGSSVASYYDNKMLIGTVMDKLGFCEINYI